MFTYPILFGMLRSIICQIVSGSFEACECATYSRADISPVLDAIDVDDVMWSLVVRFTPQRFALTILLLNVVFVSTWCCAALLANSASVEHWSQCVNAMIGVVSWRRESGRVLELARGSIYEATHRRRGTIYTRIVPRVQRTTIWRSKGV